MELTTDIIQQQITKLTYDNQAIINGKKTAAASGETFETISPIDGKVLTKVASCDQVDVDKAVKIARDTFQKGTWAQQSPQERKKVLLKLADLIAQHHLELAVLETLDMGKPINDSFNGDIAGAVETVRYYAEAIDKIYDDIAPTESNILGMITREPCGVVACIVPWNFPFYLACSRVVPALAMGNSVIVKPAEQSPLTAIKFGELALAAGVPAGAIQVLPGFGETAGQALGMHMDVDVVSFTGSTEVGKLLLHYSSQSNMKRVWLECGGKSPNIVMADCNIEKAIEQSAYGVFKNSGQICCAPTRLIADRKIKDQLIEGIIGVSKHYQPSDPLNPTTKMGTIVDKNQLDKVLSYIEKGRKEGAQLALGGERKHADSGGYYVEPTVFDKVKNNMVIAQEEIFGPVLSVISFDDFDTAIKIANDTSYGLAAGIWTNDLNKAHKAARALRAGVVSINSVSRGNDTVTFGGYKQSGIGRLGSLRSFDIYSEVKTTWIELQ